MRFPIVLVIILLTFVGCTRQVVDSWPDGSLRRTGTTVSGKQEGQWTYHHSSGALAAQGRFSHDMQAGAWTYHHDDGSVAARGSYVKGLRDGEWVWLRPDGSKERRGSYRADRQQGQWLTWDASGAARSATWFNAGIPDGPWWSRDGGTVSAGLYRNGQAIGPWLGLEATMPKGWKDELSEVEGLSLHELYDAGGKRVARLVYATGRPLLIEDFQRGLSLCWQDDGSLAIDQQGTSDAARIAAVLKKVESRAVLVPQEAPAPAEVVDDAASSMSVATVMEIAEPIIEDEVLELPSGSVDLSPAPALPGFWTGGQEANAAAVLRRYSRGAKVDNDSYFADPKPNPGNPEWHGKPLPKQRFLGADGKVLDISRYQGDKVAVVLLRGFAGQVCLYCAGQTAALVENREKLEGKGIKVVVVYPGSPASIPGFLDAVRSLGSQPELPVCLDPGLTLIRKLGLVGNLARPATVLLDSKGTVRWSHVAKDFTDRPSVEDLIVAAADLP